MGEEPHHRNGQISPHHAWVYVCRCGRLCEFSRFRLAISRVDVVKLCSRWSLIPGLGDFVRFVTTILLCTWGFFSLLGNSGIHALADSAGLCCVRSHDEASVDENSGCRHDGCIFCQKRSAQQSNQTSRSPSHQQHDAENCHLCDWLAKCQSQSLSFVVLIAETFLEFRSTEISATLIAVDVIPATSRGPPVV